MKRSVIGGVIVAALLLTAGPAAALDEEVFDQASEEASISKGATAPKKVPWRSSYFIYEHALSALSLAKGAEQRHNPDYSQALSFRPRYYVRDDLSLRARLDLSIELTTSDTTTTIREWVVSNLLFDAVYAPKWMVIPYAKIGVSPSVRLTFPTSKLGRAQSLMMGLGPGLTFRRKFDLLKGRYLKSIGLTYAFRATKTFNEFATVQLAGEICGGVPATDANSPAIDPACVTNGFRNRSWRFANTLGFNLKVMDKLAVAANLIFMYDALYTLSAQSLPTPTGTPATVEESRINHRAATWFVLDVSYDLFDWISLSAGISTFHPQLDLESDYRLVGFNRYTAFYLGMTVPVDKFVSQVQSWTGWGE